VFIDGGSDFYGEEIFRQYVAVKALSPGWRDLLSKWDISLMLLDRQTALSHETARDNRWGIWYCDSLAVMFRRRSPGTFEGSEWADSAEAALDACGRPLLSGLRHGHERQTPGETGVLKEGNLSRQQRR